MRYCNGDSPSFAPPEFKSLGNTAQILLRNTMDQNASFAMTVSYQKYMYFGHNQVECQLNRLRLTNFGFFSTLKPIAIESTIMIVGDFTVLDGLNIIHNTRIACIKSLLQKKIESNCISMSLILSMSQKVVRLTISLSSKSISAYSTFSVKSFILVRVVLSLNKIRLLNIAAIQSQIQFSQKIPIKLY